MTAIEILEIATVILLAMCIALVIALILALAGFRPTLPKRLHRARRNPSPSDPTSAPALATGEAPSSATANPAVAEQRFHPVMGFRLIER